MEMVLILAGRFVMGSPEDELDRSNSEGPQQEVSVDPFFMGKYPVTQAQWKQVAAMLQINRELKSEPSKFKGDKRPVEQVSWYDAVKFCERLSAHTSREYRLPTEAEWEYACRASPILMVDISEAGDAVGAGVSTPFHFGETITTDLANYDGTDSPDGKWSGSYGRGPKGEYRKETTPVDYFGIANAFGLCDMHGNVWEWCADHWHGNYEVAPSDRSAWLSEGNQSGRVRRGGSWNNSPRHCRSAYRHYSSPDSAYDNVGFRVVCSAP